MVDMNRNLPARHFRPRVLGPLAGALLFLGALAPRPALAATAPMPNLDGCAGKADSPEIKALVQAGHDLGTADDDRVRAAVAEVRSKAQGDAFLLLWGGSLLQRLDPKTADAMFQEAIRAGRAMVKDQGKEAAPIADLYEAAALLRLGQKEPGRARLDAVRNEPGALTRYTCRFMPAALALADGGQIPEALDLLGALQKAAPRERSVADALLDTVLRTKDEKRIDETFASVSAAFPTDVEFIVRRANHVKLSKGPDAAFALLQPLLVAGESSPSLLGEYLGLVSAAPSEARLAEYKKLAEERPNNLALQMMVGVIHHYLHHYEESSRYLEKAGALIDTEPRVAMYLAMNYIHTPGKEDQAEGMIARAAKAGRPDPDIYYCRAVIEVRKDPAGAARDLERYLALTSSRADVREEKQNRVKQTLELLRGCAKSKDPKACVQTEVVEQAKALAFAEHFGKGPPGGGPAASTKDSGPHPPGSDSEDQPSFAPNQIDGAGWVALILSFLLLGGFATAMIRPLGKKAP
jgi:tetratricopeptide (TPR) repeat protein